MQNGRTFVKIEDDESFGDDRGVVSEAYVPIMKHDRFRGAIEVYVDMTEPAIGLRNTGNLAVAGLLLLWVSSGASAGFLFGKTFSTATVSYERYLNRAKEFSRQRRRSLRLKNMPNWPIAPSLSSSPT